ncbi:MAG: hypothetical protein E7231_08475 [Cellulosilyticum sp.]|nr:hypothetical protein [Cellulosilyticum sp.]
MKIFKRLVYVAIVATSMTGSFSGLYASEKGTSQTSQVMHEFLGKNHFTVRSDTTSSQVYKPVISSIRTVTIDSKLCLMMHVQTYSNISAVEIGSKPATKRNGSDTSADYYIEISNAGTYTFYVRDTEDRTTTVTQNVTISDTKKPTVDLSKTYKNGYCYLVIDAEDNTSIASVTVNGSAISFNSNGDTVNYKVTQSKTYTVEVKDIVGNTTVEKIDIDVDTDKPSLTVDKTLKNGKWYLTIKSSPGADARISKVTVNNSKITFSSSGGTGEYAVPSTGNYTVVVTDNYNQQTTQTIYVDSNLTSDSYKPTLSVTQKNVGGVMCLAITAQPSSLITNNTLSKVTVNGMSVAIPTTGGSAEYLAATSGSYTVIATDVNGNTTSQTVYVTAPTINTTPQTSTNTSTGTASNVVFTLNQASWSRNGVTEKMDAAPIARSGRIYIPIRYVAYALNIDASKVVWNANAKSVVIYDGTNVINVPLNSKNMTVNGVSQTMEAAAISYKNRVYIPISQVAKAFSGVNLTWDNAKKQATVVRK